MKYVLRNRKTGRYLKGQGLWVRRMEEALTFEAMIDVREYCQAHRLEDVQPVRGLMPYLISFLRTRASAAGK